MIFYSPEYKYDYNRLFQNFGYQYIIHSKNVFDFVRFQHVCLILTNINIIDINFC